MDVSDVLRDRMHAPAGLQQMVGASIAVHVMLAAALILTSGSWLGRARQAPVPVMTISLGGGGGPQVGGMTTMGNRPVQVAQPPEEKPKPEPVRPPAAVRPEMTLPNPKARPTKAQPAPIVKQAPEGARGTTPTKGAQTAFGSTVAATNSPRGQGFGLASGGGPGSGSTLDVADFCCPDYLFTMIERIRSVWNNNQGATGQCVVKFTIQRDGSLVNPTVERTSGNATLDLAAQRAIYMTATRKLPPLPDQFPNPTLTVHLNFQYQQ
jgi:TonB family protein